jgi:hypothetical protein
LQVGTETTVALRAARRTRGTPGRVPWCAAGHPGTREPGNLFGPVDVAVPGARTADFCRPYISPPQHRTDVGRRVYRLPAYTPDLNPVEGIWSLLKRSMVNFAATDLDGLVRIVKRKLKKIQYRPT